MLAGVLLLQAVSVARWGGKFGMFSYALVFLAPFVLWLAICAVVLIRSGSSSAEFGSVFGEGIFAAFSLDAMWLPVGLVGLIAGLSMRAAWRWLRKHPSPNQA